jgi:hypothetical protein
LPVQDDGIGCDLTDVKDNPGLNSRAYVSGQDLSMVISPLNPSRKQEKGKVIIIKMPLTREGE